MDKPGSNQVYTEKEYCIIAPDDEFEAIDIAGYGQTIYRRKSDDTQVHQHSPLGISDGILHTNHSANWLHFANDEWHAHFVAPSTIYQQPKTLVLPQVPEVHAESLSVSVTQLGTILTTLFGTFLLISLVTHQWLIQPLLGWIGVVFGITFILMGKIGSSVKNVI